MGAFSADAPASQLPHGPGRHVPSLLLRGKILLQVLARCCTSTISHLANHPQLLQRYDVCMYPPPHMTCIHLANHPQLLLLLPRLLCGQAEDLGSRASWDTGNEGLKMAWMRMSVVSKRGGWRSRSMERQRKHTHLVRRMHVSSSSYDMHTPAGPWRGRENTLT